MECVMMKSQPAMCDKIGIMVDGVFCNRHCRQNPDRMFAKIQNAKGNKVVALKRTDDKIVMPNDDKLTMARAAAITICGQCGKHRAKKCASKPCAIRSGNFTRCPNGHWTIERLIEKADKQIGV